MYFFCNYKSQHYMKYSFLSSILDTTSVSSNLFLQNAGALGFFRTRFVNHCWILVDPNLIDVMGFSFSEKLSIFYLTKITCMYLTLINCLVVIMWKKITKLQFILKAKILTFLQNLIKKWGVLEAKVGL